jgi:hypothetical protein
MVRIALGIGHSASISTPAHFGSAKRDQPAALSGLRRRAGMAMRHPKAAKAPSTWTLKRSRPDMASPSETLGTSPRRHETTDARPKAIARAWRKNARVQNPRTEGCERCDSEIGYALGTMTCVEA